MLLLLLLLLHKVSVFLLLHRAIVAGLGKAEVVVDNAWWANRVLHFGLLLLLTLMLMMILQLLQLVGIQLQT